MFGDVRNVFTKSNSDLVLIVGVVGGDVLNDFVAGYQVALVNRQLGHLLLASLLLHSCLLVDDILRMVIIGYVVIG